MKLPGKCPRCGEKTLNYGSFDVEGDACYFKCDCNDCGFVGKEWYHLQFIEFTDSSTGDTMEDEERRLIKDESTNDKSSG